MNSLERRMVSILVEGKNHFGVVSVKAEFEAEGTRVEELLRLVDVARSAELSLTVKIGGCEAIRDLLESKQIGVRYIVAPMVETEYAVSKYILAKETVFTADEQQDTDFLFNVETITAFDNRNEIFESISKSPGVDGVVFGRVDFVGSRGLPKERINKQETTDYVLEISKLCMKYDKQFVMGGGVSYESLDVIKQVHKYRLDRFETRKVVFDASIALNSDIEQGLFNAVEFELLWLQNKQNYYSHISVEDKKRIAMLEARFQELKLLYETKKR